MSYTYKHFINKYQTTFSDRTSVFFHFYHYHENSSSNLSNQRSYNFEQDNSRIIHTKFLYL